MADNTRYFEVKKNLQALAAGYRALGLNPNAPAPTSIPSEEDERQGWVWCQQAGFGYRMTPSELAQKLGVADPMQS